MRVSTEDVGNGRRVEFRAKNVDGIGTEKFEPASPEQPIPEILEKGGRRKILRFPEDPYHLAVSAPAQLLPGRLNLSNRGADVAFKTSPVELSIDNQPVEHLFSVEKQKPPGFDSALDVDAKTTQLACKMALMIRGGNDKNALAALESGVQVVAYINGENLFICLIKLQIVTVIGLVLKLADRS
jgi:hypothetical protein